MIVIPKDLNLSYYDDGITVRNLKDNPSSLDALNNFTDSFSNSYFPSSFADTLLPPGVLYFDQSFLIYEKPPCIKNYFHIYAQVDSISKETPEHVYALPLPWQVYVIKHSTTNDSEMYIQDIYMYFSGSSIQSFDQHVYLPTLTNFWGNGKLCRPYFNSMSDVTVPNNNVAGLIELSYNWVWNSGYNADLTESVLQAYIWSQARNTPIFPGLSYSDTYNPLTTYYCSNSHAESLFSIWENMSLEQILFVNWPSPSPVERYNEYYLKIQRLNSVSDWLYENRLFPSSQSCCEDCEHYDEDGDIVENYCTQDGECSCHSENSLNLTNTYRFLSDHGAFSNDRSLREMILSLIDNDLPKRFDFYRPLLLY